MDSSVHTAPNASPSDQSQVLQVNGFSADIPHGSPALQSSQEPDNSSETSANFSRASTPPAQREIQPCSNDGSPRRSRDGQESGENPASFSSIPPDQHQAFTMELADKQPWR